MSDRQGLRAALLKLTPAQQLAVEALAAGATHAKAAEAAGVARETVTKWGGYHPGFRAAVDCYRATSAAEHVDRVLRIRGRALQIIADHLEADDVGIAAALGVLAAVTLSAAPPAALPPNPDALLDAAINATRVNLPPLPTAKWDDLLDPSHDAQRAEDATVHRLAAASGIAAMDPPRTD